MYKLLLILIILLFSSTLSVAANTSTSKEDKYLDKALDTLVILPRPLLGIEKGAIRFGFQFSVMKILIPDKSKLRFQQINFFENFESAFCFFNLFSDVCFLIRHTSSIKFLVNLHFCELFCKIILSSGI